MKLFKIRLCSVFLLSGAKCTRSATEPGLGRKGSLIKGFLFGKKSPFFKPS